MPSQITRRDLAALALAAPQRDFPIRPDYLAEPDVIPRFWVSSFDDAGRFLNERIRKGAVRVFGASAGGRPMRAVFYGEPRKGNGTTTFSGSLGYGDVRAYTGPDHGKKVYLAMAAVHGGEFEGIVGAVNLLSVLETGKDLRGRDWPEIVAAANSLDRIIVIPITNADGRARIPLRMIRHRGRDETVHEYFNTGAKPDGTIIGWPQCKRNIPLDFATTQFPGGYPNDAGVNIQHDDFFGAVQPETRALFDLAARERPDLILNMHTGAQFPHPLRSFLEPALTPAFEDLYRRMMTRLTAAGLERAGDPAKEADPARERLSTFNLDSALNLHCGAMSVLVESPAHDFSTAERDGKQFLHTPEHLLDAQLIAHQEAMKFLAETGGRARWTAKRQ
ncbi:MAG: M14 family zinc carboxypeptidase [Bryobacterales bacterium]|nr:M14 family zinc carboxypeptidase [Bryobacterales bacterium]